MNLMKETIRLYWSAVWRYPRIVLGVCITLPVTVLIDSYLPPLIVAHVLNRLSTGDYVPHQLWHSFGPAIVGYALLILTGGLIMWRLVDHFMWRLEGNVERDLARKVFSHLMDQSADFHANHFGGSLVSQYNKLLSSYIRLADTVVFQVGPMVAGIVWACVILAFSVPLYSVILFIFSITYILWSFYITRRTRQLVKDYSTIESAQTGYLADNITNVMAVKSFAGGKYENRQFDKATLKSMSALLRLAGAHQRQNAYTGSATRLISATALFMAVAGVLVFHANLAIVFLILSYSTSICVQLFQFSLNSLRNFNRSIGDASEMTEILLQKPEVVDPEKPEKVRIKKGAIAFENVIFTHNGADDALFDKLNLSIKAGEKVGLVGHSGSGKTTFTRLLLRFSDLDGGEILIDGQNIARITQDDLRSHIAYVPQEPLLFHRSISDNIAYGKTGAKESEIFRSAKKANADEFIRSLPNGYETLVGERGVKLSGGQRQRIAIARAILKDAPILLLDEATSALDSESERLIQAALWQLMAGRTAIVIAHRLSTIQKMDRIVVLDDGKIIEQGTHNELLKAKGTYAKLWRHQSGGFIEE
ncbi:MAG TPA: ABC transporter ATP-binding protein [Candidatus Saccharimonadales bacterium]|nr:ABC transporter ATP-binding protein [Candidatus Saccharimonadales bacterium]